MSDLSFVAGEFPKLAATARETADSVRSARPEGGASAFASAMPGSNLSSPVQAVEEKIADQCTKISMTLEEHADALEAAEREFLAAEEENSQLIGSIACGEGSGDSRTGGRGGEHEGPRLVPLPSPIGGGNPTPPFGRHRGNGGKQRGHQGDGRPRRRRPNIGIGRPKVEPTPYGPVGPIKPFEPIDPIVRAPKIPHPLPKPAIEIPEILTPRMPKGDNPLIMGVNSLRTELGGEA